MKITITEFKKKLNHYIDLSKKEDVVITKNGKPVARLTAAYPDAEKTIDSLVGIGSPDAPVEQWLQEIREGKKY